MTRSVVVDLVYPNFVKCRSSEISKGDPLLCKIETCRLVDDATGEPSFQKLDRYVKDAAAAVFLEEVNSSARFLYSYCDDEGDRVLITSAEMFKNALETCPSDNFKIFLDQGFDSAEDSRIQLNELIRGPSFIKLRCTSRILTKDRLISVKRLLTKDTEMLLSKLHCFAAETLGQPTETAMHFMHCGSFILSEADLRDCFSTHADADVMLVEAMVKVTVLTPESAKLPESAKFSTSCSYGRSFICVSDRDKGSSSPSWALKAMVPRLLYYLTRWCYSLSPYSHGYQGWSLVSWDLNGMIPGLYKATITYSLTKNFPYHSTIYSGSYTWVEIGTIPDRPLQRVLLKYPSSEGMTALAVEYLEIMGTSMEKMIVSTAGLFWFDFHIQSVSLEYVGPSSSQESKKDICWSKCKLHLSWLWPLVVLLLGLQVAAILLLVHI